MVTAAQLHRVATAAGREAGGVPAEFGSALVAEDASLAV